MTKKSPKYGQWALVTGGSSGIGYAFATELAEEGYDLILVARGKDALDVAAKNIHEKYQVEVDVIAMDMSVPSASQDLYDQTKDKEVGLIVLNAGMETTGHFTKVTLEEHRKLVTLNISSPVELSRLYGEEMVKRGRGGIIFLSSLFGYQGVPVVANYSASKAFILILAEAMHVELRPLGVDVLAVAPGLTETSMSTNMPIDFKKMPITKHQPEKVARVGMRALGRKASVVPGIINFIYAFENRFIPRLWPTRLFGFLLTRAIDKEKRSALLNVPHTKK